MGRTPTVTRDMVHQKFQVTFDKVTADRGGVVATGPGSVTINSPEMADRCTHLSNYLRQESGIPQKLQELGMLLAARNMDCQYIWNAHAASGRKAGLSDALVDCLRDRRPIPPLPDDEAALVNYGLELLRGHKVTQSTFQKALDQFGAQQLTELTTLMGYYTLLAFNANAFEIDLPENRTEPLLPT